MKMHNAIQNKKKFLENQLKLKSELTKEEKYKKDERLDKDFNWEGYFK